MSALIIVLVALLLLSLGALGLTLLAFTRRGRALASERQDVGAWHARLDLALDTMYERFDNLAATVTRQGADAEEYVKHFGALRERLGYFERNHSGLRKLARHLDGSSGGKPLGSPQVWLPGETDARQAARAVIDGATARPSQRCPVCNAQEVVSMSNGAVWCLRCGYANLGVSCARCGRPTVAPDHLAPQGQVCFAPDPNFQTVPDPKRAEQLSATAVFAASATMHVGKPCAAAPAGPA